MAMEARDAQVGPDERGDAVERVTVVIPARNEAACLAAALASVVAQDYPIERIECVGVDNGSTDGTAQVAEAFAAAHRELDLRVVAEPQPGVARAKNHGAREATGAILIFLDADSRMAPELTRDVVARHRASAPAGSIRVVADSDEWLERGFFDLMELGAILFGIRSQMFDCDRALFLALGGFNESLQLAEDLEFLKRVKAHLREKGTEQVGHIRSHVIYTSPRRLRAHPYHLGAATLFARWALAFAGIGRRRDYGG